MPLVKLPENTIITSLYCPRCEGVGRLYRKTAHDAPATPKGAEKAEYFYTLRCPQCGEIELFGILDHSSS